ncbi:hypothetical protein B0H14DRAFT_2636289 [Mycena olivaceomarginata]|nr:hypothetical protein B0H14DRAFT_2636289 [Mycena olivaceomarginata]
MRVTVQYFVIGHSRFALTWTRCARCSTRHFWFCFAALTVPPLSLPSNTNIGLSMKRCWFCRVALLQTQKTLGAALKQNKGLIVANAQAAASSWTADDAEVSFPDTSPADIWKPNPISKLFPQQLTAMIYKHTPERLHKLVDTADFPDFAHNTIEDELLRILLITDITDPKVWRTLVVWLDDKKNKISPYPPILYHKNARNPAGTMKNAVMPATANLVSYCAHAILFGLASLQDKGSRRPQNQTLGKMWNVVEVDTALVSFVCTMVVLICYWASLPDQKPEPFTPVGATSKIDFYETYMHFRWALERNAEDNSAKNIFLF